MGSVRHLSLTTSTGSAVYVHKILFFGSFLSVGSCLNCSTAHGNCIKGFCVCDLGWEGRSCELKGYIF